MAERRIENLGAWWLDAVQGGGGGDLDDQLLNVVVLFYEQVVQSVQRLGAISAYGLLHEGMEELLDETHTCLP